MAHPCLAIGGEGDAGVEVVGAIDTVKQIETMEPEVPCSMNMQAVTGALYSVPNI